MKKYLEDTAAYLDDDRRKRILQELYNNAYRTIHNVYIFKHFDEYVEQLQSDKNEDKKEQYWNASYYEKLIDYVKISIAFETYNKAVLIDKGYLIHNIDKNQDNKVLFESQKKGEPVLLKDYLDVSNEIYDKRNNHYYLSGLKRHFDTVNYSTTLNPAYQNIIGLDTELCDNLKVLNKKRNRLHFYIEFKGAFEVNSHIRNWRLIKDKSLATIILKK